MLTVCKKGLNKGAHQDERGHGGVSGSSNERLGMTGDVIDQC